MYLVVGVPLALLCMIDEAHAYLDPGTGSILLQATVGTIAAGLVAGKLYWRRLKDFFARGRSKAAAGGNGGPAKKDY
jgi:hypothetical protein